MQADVRGAIHKRLLRLRQLAPSLGPAIGAFVISCALWAPMLIAWDATGFGDWQQFLHKWEAARVAYLRYGELPLWNPYHCGGALLYGDPQAQGYSPLFFLSLPFGTNFAAKFFVLVHVAFGLVGTYRFCRRLNLTPVAALTGAIAFIHCGFFASHTSGGHLAFLPFVFTPWVLLLWRDAQRDRRHTVTLSLLLALTVFEGGVYPFPFFVLLLGLSALLDFPKRPLDVVFSGALVAVLTLTLSGFRLGGILATMRDYPRPVIEMDAMSFREIIKVFTEDLSGMGTRLPGHHYVIAEYYSYLGWPALLLGALGLFLLARRKHPRLLFFAAFFVLLMCGAFSPFSPWSLLHKLPAYGSLRVPVRFAVFASFFICVGAAAAVHAAYTKSRRFQVALGGKLAQLVRFSLPLLILVPIIVAGFSATNRFTSAPLPEWPEEHPGYQLTPRGEYTMYASFPARGVSTQGCYTGITSYSAASGLRMQGTQELTTTSGVRARVLARTTSTLRIEIDNPADTDATVIWNQTWAPAWTSDLGKVQPGQTGLIEVRELPPGTHTVMLRYNPPELPYGAAATLLGLILCALVWRFSAKSRSNQPDSALIPGA